MNILDFNKIKKDDYLEIYNNNIQVVFSTAEKGKNFNRHTEDGIKTLHNLKKEFNISKVIYLRQIHSDKVYTYNDEKEEVFIEKEGDAIGTNKKNIAIGVFTADCVPIILVDDKKEVVAAIHSGWKGTYNSIVKNAIEKMVIEFNSKVEDIKVYIGAHIRQCCYEISQELKEKFLNKGDFKEEELFRGRNLSLENFILKDLRDLNIKEENIYSLNLCTYCNKDVKLHSYRKSQGDYGRLFAFVIIR